MTNFAGSHSGRTREEQVFANGQWVNYRDARRRQPGRDLRAGDQDAVDRRHPGRLRDRPGPQHELRGALHAPPHARHPRGLRPRALQRPARLPGPGRPPGLALPALHPLRVRPAGLSAGTDSCPAPCAANFFIGTLEGGERDYQGVEFIFRKRYADRWQALVAYTYNDAEGNTNSDSNADFQGDVLFLDPRAPNQYGVQPGSIEHLFKLAAFVPLRLRHPARRVLPLELGHAWPAGRSAPPVVTCRSA